MKKLKVLILVISIGIIGTITYGILNWIVFLNLIEKPLPEHEEKIPDIGIVD